MARHHNNGIRKLCDCPRRNWPKCAHSWYFNFKPRGGPPYQFSLDAELGRHVTKKEDAKTEADRLRGEIRAGTFVRAADRRKAAIAPPTGVVTLTTFATIYLQRVSQARERNKSWKNDRYMFAQIAAFALPDGSSLGDKVLGLITEDDLEAVTAALRANGRAVSTRNQYVQLLKKSFRWATKKGYTPRTPISEDSALTRGKIAQRHRRFTPDVVDTHGRLTEPGEERRLLAAAGVRLQWLIIAALETACRVGELLALTWADVNMDRKELTVRAETAKDGDRRVLPISPRLAGVLEMGRTDPAGHAYPPQAYVFGALGRRVQEGQTRVGHGRPESAPHGARVWKASSLSDASRAALHRSTLPRFATRRGLAHVGSRVALASHSAHARAREP